MYDALYVTMYVVGLSGLLQFLTVLYLYLKIGKGWYWRTIMMSASALIFGKIIHGMCSRIVRVETKIDPDFVADPRYYSLAIVAEIGWILYPFAVIIINYFKIKALLDQKKHLLYLRIALMVAFLGFVGCRMYVGCIRYIEQSLSSDAVTKAHGPSYAWFAGCAVISCFLIFYFCHQKAKESEQPVYKTLMEGNLFSILIINSIMILLSITSFAIDDPVVKSFNRPVEQLKSFIPLYLAIDAVSFKYKMELRTLKKRKSTTMDNGNKHSQRSHDCLKELRESIVSLDIINSNVSLEVCTTKVYDGPSSRTDEKEIDIDMSDHEEPVVDNISAISI